jgi:hypothetical protein
VEFDLLLDAVRAAVAPSPEDALIVPPVLAFAATAANDNQDTSGLEASGLIPFP